jgi:hypothetical protein
MRPLARDSFIDNFEAHYLEEIERFGAIVMGLFRVLDEPDRFVWLRGFPDIGRRAPSLRAFYASDVWKRHGPISVALFRRPLTVRLLRPLEHTDLTAGRTLASTLSAFGTGTCSVETGVVVVDIFSAAQPQARDELANILRSSFPSLDGDVSEVRGLLVAEEQEDSWEEAVIRDSREVILVTVHRDPAATERHREAVANVTGQVGIELTGPPVALTLLPTMRSPMRYR